MGTIHKKKKLDSKGHGKRRHGQAAMSRKQEEQTTAGNSGREGIKPQPFMLLETYSGDDNK